MNRYKGKYYWVKTESGIEIGFQRYSGHWELCGISAGENINDLILDIIGEVSNSVDTNCKQFNIADVVVQSEQLHVENACKCENNKSFIRLQCPKCKPL